MFNCLICDAEFTLKTNLTQHLSNNRCKKIICKTIHDQLEELKELKLKLKNDKIVNNTVSNGNVIDTVNGNVINNNVNIKIELNINSANKLDTSYITPEYIKALIEEYDIKPDKVNLLLGGYVKDLICDPEHPENHVTKYLKRKPSTFSSIIEDKNGNKIKVIKGLKDTCELLSDPILDTLKVKLKEFLKKYRKNKAFNYLIYEETIQELRNELNKANVKKALSTVLQNDILNNIEMKLTLDNP
jgi:arginine utilization protein RocB